MPVDEMDSISSSNIGFKMLQKMGWSKEDGGLGKNNQGINIFMLTCWWTVAVTPDGN